MEATPRYTIRLASDRDVAKLPAIERAAAQLFRNAGITGSFLDETRELGELDAARREHRLWVAADAAGEPVGFALATTLGDAPHLEEIDVHPDHARRGLGAALVGAVVAWARGRGAEALTLCTFGDVAWNAPYYERLGFRVLDPAALPPALTALREREAELGLPVERRVVMRLALG